MVLYVVSMRRVNIYIYMCVFLCLNAARTLREKEKEEIGGFFTANERLINKEGEEKLKKSLQPFVSN